jgi:6-phospho-3-hexuloisomerase
MEINNTLKIIISEIESVFHDLNIKNISEFIDTIANHNSRIVLCGAGRVGYAVKGFSMRLSHLGKKSYFLGDSNVPSITQNDILLVASGSGETQSIYNITLQAKNNGSKILCVTSNTNSRIAKLSDIILELPAPNKSSKDSSKVKSIQPMTTLNEQCLSLLFDAIVMELMVKLNENSNTMWNRHSNLE